MLKRGLLIAACALVVLAARTPTFAATSTTNRTASLSAFACSTVTDIPQSECEALLALYAGSNGLGWTDQSGWLATASACSWFGVECTDGHVTSLSLYGNNLSGSIPPELANLTGLQVLFLDTNQLTGSIPSQLGSLSNLELLYLDHNQLTGSIPPQLGSLTFLYSLSLGHNQLTGSIPPALGSLGSLGVLDLSNNQLSGSIPSELGGLNTLWRLDLSSNQLSGSIPHQLSGLANLSDLYLSNNQLTGFIPSQLSSLTGLYELDMSSNLLTGGIPLQFSSLTILGSLNLAHNQLTGGIPSQLGGLASLGSLDLSSNLLTGNIPSQLGGMVSLWSLDLSSNQLTGGIPPELGGLAGLGALDLAGNLLSGAIPPQLGSLAGLQELSLSSNQLTGGVPPEIGALGGLQTLSLDHNQLTGALPLSLTNLSLTQFWFDSTGLCEPADAVWQTWLAGIAGVQRTAVICPVAIPLSVGWNMISLPLAPASTLITQTLASIAGSYNLVYAYNALDTLDFWKKYNTAAPPFLNDLTVISESMGIWLNATAPVTLTLTGTLPVSPSILLTEGWNLVGYPSMVTRPVTVALSSCTGRYDLVYAYAAADTVDPWKKYNTAAPSFLNDLVEMAPGKGYWINATQACVWSMQ